MTICYKLFGIPQTIEEFADKLKKKGLTAVTVGTHFEMENEETDWQTGRFLAADYVDYIAISAGKFEYISRCREHSESISSSCARESEFTEIKTKKLKQKMITVAEELKDLNLETRLDSYSAFGTLNPITIEEAKKIAGIN